MTDPTDERVLVLAPGRDGELTCGILGEAGFACHACATADDLCDAVRAGAGAAVLAEEVLTEPTVRQLAATLNAQPPWSDLPVILVAAGERPAVGLVDAVRAVGNVSVLGRPMPVGTLVTVVGAALRSRRRQLQVRDLLSAREQEARRKDEYLAMLAHELRNPLAPVSNAAHFLKLRTGHDPALRTAHETIGRQVRQMSRLIDGLLDVARVTQGKVGLAADVIDLREVVSRAVEAARTAFGTKGHAVAVAAPDRPVFVEADADRLEQVVGNLLDNAAKFTPPGGRIDLAVGPEAGGAAVRVRDTGVGIPADRLADVFDLFVQIDAPIERTAGGLGVGLTLAKRLVELHRGTIEARSDGPGRGAEFLVRLPLAPAATAGAGPVASPPAPAALRVLVVDDNEDGAESLATLLELQGHEVRTAFDGPSGLATAEACRPHVIVCDIGMPGMDGYEVARRVRRTPDLSAVRLVALTGYGSDDDRRRSREAGFDAHVVKPVDPNALAALLPQCRQ